MLLPISLSKSKVSTAPFPTSGPLSESIFTLGEEEEVVWMREVEMGANQASVSVLSYLWIPPRCLVVKAEDRAEFDLRLRRGDFPGSTQISD